MANVEILRRCAARWRLTPISNHFTLFRFVIKTLTMINNQSDEPENFEPKDSKRKDIKHPQDDKETVLNPEDKDYDKENADYGNIADKKAKSEQPVNPGNPDVTGTS